MGLYCGIDLHSTNSYVVVMNEQLQSLVSGLSAVYRP